MHCRSVFIKQKKYRLQWSKIMLGHFCFALEKKGHIRVFCTVRLDIPADVKRNNTGWSSMANTLFEKKMHIVKRKIMCCHTQ